MIQHALPKSVHWTVVAPYVAFLGGMLSLPLGNALAKQLFSDVGAAGTTFYRTAFSALILLAIWRPWRQAWRWASLRTIACYGVVVGGMNLCFYAAIKTIPLGVAMAIEFLGPLGVALFYSRRRAHFAMLGLAVLGLTLLLPVFGTTSRLDPAGLGFALITAIFWALYIVYGARTAGLHPGRTVAIGITTAALITAPVGIVSAGAALWNPHFMLLGVAVAVLSCAIPFSLEMIALQGISKRSFGILAAGEPAMGAAVGALALAEHLSARQWIAIACIVVASIGSAVLGGEDGGGKDEPAGAG